jgi:hypothetical protein
VRDAPRDACQPGGGGVGGAEGRPAARARRREDVDGADADCGSRDRSTPFGG